MAAEYEVNIKINSDKIVTDLNKVDNKIKNLGKSATSQEKSFEKIVDKRARLMNRINELDSKGLNVAKLRKQMGKATTEQGRKDLGNAQKEFRVLERTIRLEQSKLRILRAQRQGFPASPIRGIRSMMGSPAQIAASGRQRVSPIGGRIDIAGSPAQMAAIKKMEMAEIRADKNVHFAELKLIQKRQKVELDNVDKLLQANIKSLESFDKRLEAANAKRLAGNRNQYARPIGPAMAPMQGAAFPIGGAAGIPGSPEFNRALEIGRFRSSPIGGAVNIAGSPAARKARREQLEQVGLGAGFPLLFGGGAGSVIGGGLGGLTGSFGAQIAFSAIGQQIDQFIASVGAVGTALTSASGTVEMFREKNLFSSDAVKEHAFQLEEQGKMQELATLLTKDLASQIGVNAVNNFQLLGGELKTFLGTINQLFLSVQGFVAGPLAKLLGAINTVLGGVSTDLQFGNLRRSLTGDAAAQFEAIIAETRGTRELSTQERQRAIRKGESTDPVEGRLTTTVKEAVLKDPRVAALRQTINVTGQTTLDDTLGFKPPKPPKPPRDREAERAKRLMERSRERIQLLGLEAKKIGEITVFKDKIAQAERDGDEQLVIRLNTERKLAEIASKEDKLITKLVQTDLPAEQKLREQIAIQTQSTAQANEAIAEGQRQLADFQQKEDQRRAQAMQKYIDQQYELNIAVQQQLALADGISNVMGQGMTQAFDALINGAENWGRALQDIAANVLRDIARQLIQIYVIEQAIGFMKNLLSPAPPLLATSALPGTSGFGVGIPSTGKILQSAPARADGGSVSSGRPYFVGERGPELFVPGASGNIVPNHAMGGANVTVNVDASGTQAQGNQPNAKLLGQAIGAAVQAELIKQKRPGGLLAV